MDALVNRPNTILKRQIALQSDPRPVYLKTPRARLYMGAYLGIFGVGLLGATTGLYKMIIGDKS